MANYIGNFNLNNKIRSGILFGLLTIIYRCERQLTQKRIGLWPTFAARHPRENDQIFVRFCV